MPVFTRASELEAPQEDVARWHARRGAFERLVPPWQSVSRTDDDDVAEGSIARLRLHAGPLSLPWDARHEDVAFPHRFVDVQERGPFRSWRHEHVFEARGAKTLLTDRVTYELPLDPLSRIGDSVVVRMLSRLFDYRHRVTRDDVRAHASHDRAPLRVAVTGASGLVGRALVPYLTTGGHDVVRLVRHAPTRDDERAIDFSAPSARAFDDTDAVVHLAGAPIAEGRFDEAHRRAIRTSRVDATRALARALADLKNAPRVVVSSSAIGFYGDRGDEVLDERSARGDGFLADVCAEWEAAWAPAEDAGIRVVKLRTGVVLSPSGGALRKLLPPFRAGLGGPIADGRMYMSTIALDDLLDVVLRALTDDRLVGPVNAVGPEPLTNAQFSSTLARVLRRPCLFRVPRAALTTVFGDMARETLLASQRVVPRALTDVGHTFRFDTVEEALRHVLGR